MNFGLPNDENKLFDVDDDIGASTIPDLSVAIEDQEEEIIPNNVLDHAIDTLFKLSTLHSDGKSFRKCVQYQNMATMEQFYQWDERHSALGDLSTSYFEPSWDKSSPEFLKTNPIKNLLMLWKYMGMIILKCDFNTSTSKK